MQTYKATNNKVIDIDKMHKAADLTHPGQYGKVYSGLYRTRKGHNWYIVSESCWSGTNSISSAEYITWQEAARLVMEHCADNIKQYPELKDSIETVVDE